MEGGFSPFSSKIAEVPSLCEAEGRTLLSCPRPQVLTCMPWQTLHSQSVDKWLRGTFCSLCSVTTAPMMPRAWNTFFFFSGHEVSRDFPAAAAKRESFLRIFPVEMEVCPSLQLLWLHWFSLAAGTVELQNTGFGKDSAVYPSGTFSWGSVHLYTEVHNS